VRSSDPARLRAGATRATCVGMQTIHSDELATVVGGANIGGVEQGDDGKSNFAMNNIPKGTPVWENSPRPDPVKQGVERYNNFYDRYTGAIETLNGIGGGAAVAGGAKPTPALGF
jgi:hypothetical protein